MKLTIALLTVAFLQVHASGSAQSVTISGKGISLKEVFTAIKKQTGYVVFAKEDDMLLAAPLSIAAEDMPLRDLLDVILKDQPFDYLIKDRSIVLSRKPVPDVAFYQERPQPVNGKVVDSLGNPVPGVSIRLSPGNHGTSTAADGTFTISNVLPKEYTMEISIMGFAPIKRKIKVTAVSPVTVGNVVLTASSVKLNEVTVTTAYGIERSKKELGYSVAKVSGEEINRANSGSILNGLTGKVSGLNIMSQSSEMSPRMRVLLRGIRSFGQSSNNQPLFIFNGAPLSFGSDGDAAQRAVEFINNLNPADIEDVTVLKGANGTAMYGPEGVNGVIMITTKKGKPGELSINARVNTSFNRFDFRQRVDQRTFGVGDAGGIGVGGQNPGSWGPTYDGKLIPIGYPDKNGQYQKVPYSDLNDRYNFFDVAKLVRANVSVSEGDAKSSYYIGAGYVSQNGLLPGDKQNQTTFMFNSNKRVARIADIQISMNYSHTESDRGADVTSKVLNTPSFIPLLSYKDYENSYWGGTDTYWSGVNPYFTLGNSRADGKANAFSGSFTTNIKVLPWLNIKDQVSVNYEGQTSKTNTAPIFFSDFARADPSKNLDVEPTTKDYTNNILGFNNDLLLTSLHRTGNFLIRGNAGTSIRDNFTKTMQGRATLVIPVYNVIYVRSDQGVGVQEASVQTRSISAFGNVSVGYKDRAFLELTGRNEWDSKRAKVARGKDFYFGANTSLLLKEIIPLLKEQSWLTSFRLRLSAAHTANMNIVPYQSERTLGLIVPYPFTNPATGKSILGYGTMVNPNPFIQPEKVFSQEYGTEMAFFNNRIRFDASYYHQINNGVIMDVGVPSWSGYPSIDNAGRFRNSGWEFDLNFNPLVNFGKDIYVNLTGRFSINNNMVLSVADVYKGTFIAKDPQGGALYYARVGHSAFEFPALDFKRNPDGKVIVDKNTGLPTVDTQNPKILGKTLPVYQGGFTLNFIYKRFTFSTQADYSAGNDHAFDYVAIQQGINSLTLMNNREVFIFPNSVIEDSPGHFVDNTKVAVSNAGKDLFSRFAAASIHTISSAAYWKIRELSLQYDLPLKTRWVKKVTGSIYARDLFSFYPPSNLYGDPVSSQGPGLPPNQSTGKGTLQGSQNSNVGGGTSDPNAGPGTMLYGFTLGIQF